MNPPRPPRFALALLQRFCAAYWREELEGNLAEEFEDDVLLYGIRGARWRYWRNVIRFMRPYIIRQREAPFNQAWGGIMLRNYLTVALRTFRKNAGYTFINVSGLAVGMACCLLILLLIRHEWSYDSFHANADRIYRTYVNAEQPDGDFSVQAMMSIDFTENLLTAYPQIETATRVVGAGQNLTVNNRTYLRELMEADPAFFEIFSFPFLAGDPATALAGIDGIILTAETTDMLFPNHSGYGGVLGESVTIDRGPETYAFTVTAVIADVPSNSSLLFDAMISFDNHERIRLGGNNWSGRTSTYVLLPDDLSSAVLEAQFPPFTNVEFARFRNRLLGFNMLVDREDALQLKLQPLRALHLTPAVWTPYEVMPHNPIYSYILGGIGLLVLLIACINFMTLSVGRSTSRAREVGMRKALGAVRGQLMRQFWGEAFILSSVALLLGFALASLALPAFNDLTQQTLSLGALRGLELGLAVVVLMIIVGLVAGGYPAVVLSRFHPSVVFKGALTMRGNHWLTRSLVVLQYTISIGLIVSTIIMMQQLTFLLEKDLGFEDDGVVAIQTRHVNQDAMPALLERFRTRLVPQDGIVALAGAELTFTRGSNREIWEDASGQRHAAYHFAVDYNYLDVMGMDLIAGRFFSEDLATDRTHGIVVNEAFARDFGVTPEEMVGTPIDNWITWIFDDTPNVLGVVRDFNYRSLHEEVPPVAMHMHPDRKIKGAMLIRIQPENISQSLQSIEAAWTDLLPDEPFNYSFVDEDMDQLYQTEERWSQIVQYASLFAIAIACLGLLGLSTLTVAKRTKEIGIRKVLGASVPRIVSLVALEFAKLVILANLLAWPLAYLGMQEWLTGFAYQIGISPWAFLSAGLAALLIALGTISYQTIRAATANPVKALRYE